MESLKNQLIQAYKDENFFEFIQKIYYQDRKGDKILASALIEAHNNKEIDLIVLFSGFKNSPEQHDFFSVRRVLEEVLPELDAPVIITANCVKHLTLEAGQDMAAGMLVSPFISFCANKPTRPTELLKHALALGDKEFDHVSTALIAGAKIDSADYIRQAISLISGECELVKQRAIFALGRMNLDNEEQITAAVNAIMDSTKTSKNDQTLATSLRALFALTSRVNKLEMLLLSFLDCHSEHRGENFIHAASETLFYDAEKVSLNVGKRLLDICIFTPEKNSGTINNLDYALEKILKRNDFEACIKFFDEFFQQTNYKVSIKGFDSFVRELHNYKDTYLSTLITKWLLSQNIYLCKFSLDLVRDFDKGLSLSFDANCIPSDSEGVYVYLARKACGWFFNQPKTAISLIESLISNAPDSELNEIEKAVFNPLCISYPRSITEQMESSKEAECKRLAQFANNVLTSYENYQNSIRAAVEIEELKPSESDRHTYWRHHNKLMDESMKKARSKSFLTSLFAGNESVLLYGNKSIHYIHHGDQKTRQEIPLQEISHSFEFASMHNVDPHGLENILWQFKAEGCKA